MIVLRLKLITVIAFSFTVVNFCCGQSRLDAGYKAMGEFNFALALKVFNHPKHKGNIEAIYGKALLYSNPQTSYYNPDSAWYYSNKCLETIKHTNVIVKKKPSEQEVMILRTKILEDVFAKTVTANTIEAYEYYLRNFAAQQFTDSAKMLMYTLSYNYAQKANTWQAYKDFTDIYKNAPQYEKAIHLYHTRLYESYTADNSLISYENFLKNYSESPYKQDAEDWLFKLSTIEGNPEDYENFIKKYPDNFRVPDAWNALYALKTSDGSLSSIEDFQNSYPNYPDLGKLLLEMEQARTFYFPIYNNNLWGYADSTGSIRVEPQFDSEQYYINNYAVVEKGGKFGVINKSGTTVIYFSFDEIEQLDNGFFIVKRDDKYGVINITGNYVLKCIYDDIKSFEEDMIAVKRDGSYGFYDRLGKQIIHHKYIDANSFKLNTGIVAIEANKYFLIDRNGNKTGNNIFQWIEPFKSSLTRFKSEDLFGLTNINSEIILAAEYQLILPLADSSYLLVKDNKCGFADKNGKISVPLTFDYSESYKPEEGFVNGLIKVVKNKKAGLVNKVGKVIMPFQFDDIGKISNKGLPLSRKGKWAMADKQFKLLTKFKYDYLSEFTDGFARYKQNGQYGLIDETGVEVLPAKYTSLVPLYNGVFLSEQNEEKYIIDFRGNKLVDTKIKDTDLINNNYLVMILEDGLFYYNCKDGKVFGKYSE